MKVRGWILTIWALLFGCGMPLVVESVKLKLEDLTWQKPRLPDLTAAEEIQEGRAEFAGRVPDVLKIDCDLACQIEKDQRPLSLQEIENEMSYETLDVPTQVRIKTVVNVSDVPGEILQSSSSNKQLEATESANKTHSRSKRAVFGYDTRFTLSTERFSTMFPFSTAVKISTGCAGVLVSPKHVLTSAHCLHDGKRYLKGVRKLRVGRYVKRKVKKGRKKGKKRNKKKKSKKRTKKNGAGRRNSHGSKVSSNSTILIRSKRAATRKGYKFKWTRAKKTHIPQSWLKPTGERDANLMVEYDYAIISLKRSLGTDHMDLGISPVKEHLPRNQRIHFTAFDQGLDKKLLYRYCSVEEQSSDMMYHKCDAQKGTSGAGIYIRLYDRDAGTWNRKVIGVFSGHQWVDMGEGLPSKEYNTGVRITPLKYAQICFWTTGDYSRCRNG